jgi:hypothetical protein
LQANLQGRQACGTLLAQALRDFQAVDAVHPIKMLGHPACLVALNGPNAMPHAVLCDRVGAQQLDFFNRFLNVVFAKIALAIALAETGGSGRRQRLAPLGRKAPQLASSG